jgi:hypothetical protein
VTAREPRAYDRRVPDAPPARPGPLARIGGWLGRHALARTALVFVAGAVVGGILVWAPWQGDDRKGRFDFESTAVPGEYLYLDPERVVSYLAQIRGGVPGEETQTESTSEQVDASAGAAVSGSFQRRREAGVSRVVTPTTAADFLSLMDKLDDPDLQRPRRLKEVVARTEPPSPEAFAAQVLGLTEGDFVIIRNVRVLMPLHVRPYDAIRRLGPRSFSTDRAERREIRRYAATVGPDPLVVFNVGAHTSKDDGAPLAGTLPDGRVRLGCPSTGWPAFGRAWPAQDPVNARVLVPVRYSLLAPETSLLSGGDSIIVGKVIRVLRPPSATGGPAPRESDVCFRDQQARNAFGLTADRIPASVTASLRGASPEAIRESLDTYAAVRAPAAIVVPVAIYR